MPKRKLSELIHSKLVIHCPTIEDWKAIRALKDLTASSSSFNVYEEDTVIVEFGFSSRKSMTEYYPGIIIAPASDFLTDGPLINNTFKIF